MGHEMEDAAGHGHKGSNVVLKLGRSVRELFEGPSGGWARMVQHLAHRVPAR